jgi:hypothetical protein
MELQTLFLMESAADTFLSEIYNKARPLFPDPSNGAAFVPESKTSSAGLREWLGFLLVGFKTGDKKGGRKNSQEY